MHKLNETNENGWLAQITYGSVFIRGHGYQAGVFSQTFCQTKQMLVFFTSRAALSQPVSEWCG
jgi:hypothetical protein